MTHIPKFNHVLLINLRAIVNVAKFYSAVNIAGLQTKQMASRSMSRAELNIQKSIGIDAIVRSALGLGLVSVGAAALGPGYQSFKSQG